MKRVAIAALAAAALALPCAALPLGLRRATEKAAVSNVTVIVNARAEAEQAARIAAAATNAAFTAAALDALTGEAPALGEANAE